MSGTAKSDVLDRELEEEKKPTASEPPRIRCPLCGWSLRPEPLIPEHPTHVQFCHSPFGVEDEIVRVFQMFEDMFGQIW